jgi:hypothetical protein
MIKTTYRNLEPYCDINQNIHSLASLLGGLRYQLFLEGNRTSVHPDELDLLYKSRNCLNDIIHDLDVKFCRD